jgi:hypothetical protein
MTSGLIKGIPAVRIALAAMAIAAVTFVAVAAIVVSAFAGAASAATQRQDGFGAAARVAADVAAQKLAPGQPLLSTGHK